MADELDLASELSERLLNDALEKRKQIAGEEEKARQAILKSGTVNRECVDCGEDIPMARLVASPKTQRCALCQSELERR